MVGTIPVSRAVCHSHQIRFLPFRFSNRWLQRHSLCLRRVLPFSGSPESTMEGTLVAIRHHEWKPCGWANHAFSSGIYGRKKATTRALASTKMLAVLGKRLCEPAEHINQQRNARENGFHRELSLPTHFNVRSRECPRHRRRVRTRKGSVSCEPATV